MIENEKLKVELEKLEKQRKSGIAMAVIFLFSAILFFVLAVVTKKYSALLGVLLQLIASTLLFVNNKM